MTRRLPQYPVAPVPPVNNPAFEESQYAAVNYEEVGNVAHPRARAPQYDAVEFVCDKSEYAGLGPRSTYNLHSAFSTA